MAMMQNVSAKESRSRGPLSQRPHERERDRPADDAAECDAAYAQGTACLSRGAGGEAVAWLQRAVALGPNRPEIHTTLGIALTREQRFDEAEACFREVVRLRPELAEAQNDLGNLLRLQGRIDEAIECFETAVELRSDCVEAYLNLGLTLTSGRAWAEAVPVLARALELRPNEAGGHFHLASALSGLGRWQEAVGHYREALRLRPDLAEVHGGLANALRYVGHYAEALSHCLRALAIRPNLIDVHACFAETLALQGQREDAVTYVRQLLEHQPSSFPLYSILGATLLKLRQAQDAERCLRLADSLCPDDAETLNNLGTALWEQNSPKEAEVYYRRSLELRPDNPDVLNNLGNALWELRRVQEAEARYRQSLALRPDSAEGHLNLGIVHTGQGKLDEAIGIIQRSIELCPHAPAAHNGLGMTYARQGRVAEALACYEEALRIQPDYAEARRNRAMAWLAQGDLERGWPEHEWRWQCRGHSMPVLPRPLWQGEDLQGKTILLHAEQGYGDTLQFIRYASVVKRLGATVLVVCPEPLVRLLAHSPGIDGVLKAGVALPDYDFHAPMMSLPAIVRTTLETIPSDGPYLFADRDEAGFAAWKSKLSALTGMKIGIAWQGNPEHKLDYERSFRLAELAPLAESDGVQLVSLQKGFGAEQIPQLDGRFPVVELEHLEPSLRGDFLETAQVIKNLDLVVTPDSAIAHLSGGLGVPVWLALPVVAECRWLIGCEDSPWYPTMRLFRQTEAGDWPGVFRRMAAALKGL